MYRYLVSYRFYTGKGMFSGNLFIDSEVIDLDYELGEKDLGKLADKISTKLGLVSNNAVKVLSFSKLADKNIPIT